MGRRFPIIFLVLWALPTSIALLPKGEVVTILYLKFWNQIFRHFNDAFLHWPARMELNGSGDAAENYFALAVVALVAALIAGCWRRFGWLERWFNTYLRWHLAALLLVYGFGKVFPPGQFESLTSNKLSRPLGDFSLMGLMWAFMAASRPYAIFGGLSEVLGGCLLLFPRFETVGALVSLGVMTNVFVLNLSYDVPVKLFSLQLVLISLWILRLDRTRLIQFALGRPVPAPSRFVRHSREAWISNLAAVFILVSTFVNEVRFSIEYHENLPSLDRSYRLLKRGFHFINEKPDND